MRFLNVQVCSKEIIQSEFLLNRMMQKSGAEGFSEGTRGNLMETVFRRSDIPNYKVRLLGTRGSTSVREAQQSALYGAGFY